MSISAELHAAVLRKIDYAKRWLDMIPDLDEVVITVVFDRKTKEARFVKLDPKTQYEIRRVDNANEK